MADRARRITDTDLLAYAAGELAGEEARRVEARLEADAEARSLVARYREVRDLLASDDSEAPPADVVARAKAVYKPIASPRTGWLERIDALVATLIFDSRVQPATVRYADADHRFQLAFETRTADIDLQGERIGGERAGDGGSRWRLVGQVAADRSAAPCRVALVRSGQREPQGETVADERGMFTLEIGGGTWDVYIEMDDQVLVLPAIEID